MRIPVLPLASYCSCGRSRRGTYALNLAAIVTRPVCALALAAVLFAGAGRNAWAYYDVTIGTADTAGAWAGNEWIPSGTGSTVSASTIESKLVDGPVTIGTGTDSDGGTEDGDITVSSAVSWDANTLTLTANVLNINAVMTAGGSAGLAVNVGGYFDGALGRQVITMINTGMGSGGFIGRVDFTGSNNTISFNGTPGVIITTLGEAGDYCSGNGLQGIDSRTGNFSVIHVLGADIDATPTAGWNNGLGFMPLGITCSSPTIAMSPLDGLGHTIDGLTINRPTKPWVGLIESVTWMAQNIGLTNVNIVGAESVGALSGSQGFIGSNGRIANVFVTGSVTATGPGLTRVGGLLGDANRWHGTPLSITNVYSSANVTGIDNVGGLMGGFDNGGINRDNVTLDGAYTTGTISGRYDVGALIGTFDGSHGGVITNVYTTATVNATGSASGMIGARGTDMAAQLTRVGLGYFDGQMNLPLCYPVSAETLIVDHLYHNSETLHLCGGSNVTVPDPGLSAPLTNAQMKQQASYVGFDFDNTWVIYEDNTTPILRSMEGLFDSDGDGYYNNEDAFPVDTSKWYDNPDAFSFTSQTRVSRNTVVTSNAITVSGVSVATPISIASCTAVECQYAVNGGAWRSDVGRVNNGDSVQVRQIAAEKYATETDLTLNIGDVAASFSVTTTAAPEKDGGAFGLWFLVLLPTLLRRRPYPTRD